MARKKNKEPFYNIENINVEKKDFDQDMVDFAAEFDKELNISNDFDNADDLKTSDEESKKYEEKEVEESQINEEIDDNYDEESSDESIKDTPAIEKLEVEEAEVDKNFTKETTSITDNINSIFEKANSNVLEAKSIFNRNIEMKNELNQKFDELDRLKEEFEEKRLSFNGSAIQLFGNWIKWLILTIITLGIYAFWLNIALKKWKTKHTFFE